MSDLVWRNDRWVVQPENVHESGLRNLARRATEHGPRGKAALEILLPAVIQAYRILLTRALKGVYAWVEDDETRSYLTQATAS